jgi:putative peptidoglycan lipid II flippase
MTKLSRSLLIVAVFFGLEKLLGFLRQVFVARTFGLSAELDAFNAANNLPDLIFALISGGALAIAFIPVLSDYLETKGRPAMWDLFSRVANLVFLVTAGLSILVALFANPLVGWRLGIAPGFGPEQQALVASLMRLNLFATLLFSLGGLVIAGLQANQHFFLPALAPSMYDLGTLFGVLILAPAKPYTFGPITLPAFGLGVYGLVYGVILGAALFLLIQLPGLFKYRFRWTPAINLRHPGVLRVLSLMGPRLLTVGLIQIAFVTQDNLASRLATGTITALVYGWLFMQVPETIIGTALGTVLLPTLSEQTARLDQPAFSSTLNRALRLILALAIPATALFAISLRPIVAILGLDPAGTELVVWTARAFLLGLLGHSLLEVSVRAFYAQKNALTPLLTYSLMVVAFLALAIPLGFRLGSPGIGLANSLAYTANAVVLWILLGRRYPGLLKVTPTLLRVLLAVLFAGALAWAIFLLPLPPLLLSLLALLLGALVALPFIWPEVKLLVKL